MTKAHSTFTVTTEKKKLPIIAFSFHWGCGIPQWESSRVRDKEMHVKQELESQWYTFHGFYIGKKKPIDTLPIVAQ